MMKIRNHNFFVVFFEFFFLFLNQFGVMKMYLYSPRFRTPIKLRV